MNAQVQVETDPAPRSSSPSGLWFCVHHRTFRGPAARLDLRRSGCEVHWPREIVRQPRRDDVTRPLFPGYLFAQAPSEGWGIIVRSPEVLAVLGVREFGQPTPAPRGFVEALIDLAGSVDSAIDRTGDRAPAKLKAGDLVTLMGEGPFRGFSAIVKADDGGERVKVLLQLFGRSSPVTVARTEVKAS